MGMTYLTFAGELCCCNKDRLPPCDLTSHHMNCSSWVSHYPPKWKGGNVVGLGMNEYELSQNKQLSSYVVRDLNNEPTFPFEDNSFDKVRETKKLNCKAGRQFNCIISFQS